MSEYYQGRAKQFLPYAALRGFDEMVNEKHRITEEKQEFFEDVERIISERISLIKTGRDVTVRVFNKGERYTIKGIVKGVDFAVSTLTVGKLVQNRMYAQKISHGDTRRGHIVLLSARAIVL